MFRSSVAKSLEAQYSGTANIPEVALLHLLRWLVYFKQTTDGVCPALFTSLQHASESRTVHDAEGTRSLSEPQREIIVPVGSPHTDFTLRNCSPRSSVGNVLLLSTPEPYEGMRMCTYGGRHFEYMQAEGASGPRN